LQAKAADAPASAFVEESTALLAQGKFEEYVAKLQPHLDLVCSKCSDKGEGSSRASRAGAGAPAMTWRRMRAAVCVWESVASTSRQGG